MTRPRHLSKTSREDLVAQLAGMGAVVRGSEFRCVFHDDRSASGSIFAGEDGAWRWRCHTCDISGDVFDLIARHTGRPLAEVLKEYKADIPRSAVPRTNRKRKRLYETLEKAIEAARGSVANDKGVPLEEVKTSRVDRYHRADGTVAGLEVRFDYPNDKAIRPIHYNGEGFVIGDPPGKWPLFGLVELLKNPDSPILVVEGPKCAEIARTLGFVATTSAHGALAASKTDFSPLAGREVWISPDFDDAGERYANDVNGHATQLSPPAIVRIVRLPGLQQGEDIEQYVEQRECLETDEIRRSIEDLASNVAPIRPKDAATADDDRLVVRVASSIETKPISFLWPDRFVAGGMNLICGMPDVGKSALTCDIAARVSRGLNWPFSATPSRKGKVVILAVEDSLESTLVPRLQVAGADLDQILFVDAVRRMGDNGMFIRDTFDIGRDVVELELLFKKHPDIVLVIIDPYDSYVGNIDTRKGNEVRRALWPLKDFLERTGITAIIVHHFNKNTIQSALDRVSGSRSIGAMPRSVWMAGWDETTADVKLVPMKLNVVQRDRRRGLSFKLVPSLENPQQPVIHWTSDDVRLSADEVMSRANPAKTTETVEFMRDLLAKGPLAADEVRARCEAAGISYATASKKQTKEQAGVVSEQVRKDGKVVGWKWRLRASEDLADSGSSSDVGDQGDLGDLDSRGLEATPLTDPRSTTSPRSPTSHSVGASDLGGTP